MVEEEKVELTDEAIAELAKTNWGEDDEQPPGEGSPAADYEEETPPKEAEEEGAKADEALPELTAEQIADRETYEKRFKDTQQAFTQSQQENARLQQELMARRFEQPQFVPEYPPQQQYRPQQQPEELQYATETERQLAQRLEGIEQRQAIRDHEARLAQQRENQRRADDIVSNFRSGHPDMKDEEIATVLQRANQANTFDLDLTYRGMRDYNAEIEAAKKEAIEGYIAKKKEGGKAILESSDGGVKPPEKFDARKYTDDQLNALMVEELKGG